MKIRDVLTDESRWTKGRMVEPPPGEPGTYVGLDCKRCLAGWILYCYGDWSYSQVLRRICDYLGVPSVAPWNDHPQRTFAEVKTLVDTLDI